MVNLSASVQPNWWCGTFTKRYIQNGIPAVGDTLIKPVEDVRIGKMR